MKLAVFALVFLPSANVVLSQDTSRVARPVTFVGTDDENYLRYLQVAGKVAPYPWSLRGFSPIEMDRLRTARDSSPWARRISYRSFDRRFNTHLLPIDASFRLNSAFPFGANDGAIWAGRGVTSAISGGFVALLGPLTVVVAPVAFHAANSAFALMPTGQGGRLEFADPIASGNVDLPQRFGNASYGRIDPGHSTIRFDLLGVTAGVSSANMGWGPMHSYQYILGANAPGIPHIFLGTGSPRSVGIGKIHGRVIWGRLEQSDYSPVAGTPYYSSPLESGTRRFATGVAATFEPRGISGLEFGGARFFHLAWPRSGPPRSYFTRVLESLLKTSLPASRSTTDTLGGENQLASAFARWVFPKGGFEVYGEYGREDHNYDARDFFQEPDHVRTYGLGLRKIIHSDSLQLSGVRAEMINYLLPALARKRVGEGSIYLHGSIRQGHTNRGQGLGADAGVGSGAASTLAWDRYTARGRTTLGFERIVRRQRGTFFENGTENPRGRDVQLVFGAEQVRFLPRVELTTAMSLVRELNRYFERDAWNLNALIGIRFRPLR